MKVLADMNAEERSRYVALDTCDFLVASIPSDGVVTSEKIRDHIERHMVELISFPIIDKASSPIITRAYFIPFVSPKLNRFGTYNIYVSKKSEFGQKKQGKVKKNV